MADITTYDTGTVEVGPGGTIVYGTDTFWSAFNARGGDDLTIAGKGPVVVIDRLGPNQLKIRPWQHGPIGPGASYEIVPRATSRISGLEAFEDYMRVMRAMTEIGFIHNVPAGTAPNAGVGYEGQDAFDHSTGKGWRRAAGVWNYRGKIAGLTFSQEPWSAAETYAAGIIVPRGVSLYKSLVDGNLNFPPESNPGQWSVYTPGSNVYTGALALANGSTATAALGFIGETNTGIFKASEGRVGFTGSGILTGRIGTEGTEFFGNFHTMGAGGTGGQLVLLNLNGGSGDTGGSHIRYSKNHVIKWYVGLTSSLAGGFSDDFAFYTADRLALSLIHATGQVMVAAAIASSSTTTGALVVTNGGMGVAGSLNVGGQLALGVNALSGKLGVQQTAGAQWTAVFQNTGVGAGDASHGILVAGGPVGSAGNLLVGFYDSAFGNVGSITRNGASQVSFNIASDVRLKDRFDESGIDWGSVIDGLWVGDFVFKTEPDRVLLGVKAQQANEYFPQAISRDTHNDMWVADYSKFAPLALWGVKRSRDDIRSLEQRLAIIENRLSI